LQKYLRTRLNVCCVSYDSPSEYSNAFIVSDSRCIVFATFSAVSETFFAFSAISPEEDAYSSTAEYVSSDTDEFSSALQDVFHEVF
jgi:hypothetical protein